MLFLLQFFFLSFSYPISCLHTFINFPNCFALSLSLSFPFHIFPFGKRQQLNFFPLKIPENKIFIWFNGLAQCFFILQWSCFHFIFVVVVIMLLSLLLLLLFLLIIHLQWNETIQLTEETFFSPLLIDWQVFTLIVSLLFSLFLFSFLR